jgi:thioester reductase-like protein
MSIFLTGSTGYLGSYVVDGLLRGHTDRLSLLVRAKNEEEGRRRLWKAWQMHMDFETFQSFQSRVDIVLGDLTDRQFGLDDAAFRDLAHRTESVLHIAASLNRKSAKVCFNVNLRGTLEVVKLAQAARDHHGLRRFSDVSTVAIAGHRQDATLGEDEMLDWDRSDYDPYARTKKFCEHMVHELLPDVPVTVFRPSTVLGDSRFPETTQFDMVRAFVYLASLPVVPLSADWRMDIVPANYVGEAIVHIHQLERPKYGIYNLSSGRASQSYSEIVAELSKHERMKPKFVPSLSNPFASVIDQIASSKRRNVVTGTASLLHVFLPYLRFNTVFDNARVVEELGYEPAVFTDYAWALYRFAKDGGFTYPYLDWPETGREAAE